MTAKQPAGDKAPRTNVQSSGRGQSGPRSGGGSEPPQDRTQGRPAAPARTTSPPSQARQEEAGQTRAGQSRAGQAAPGRARAGQATQRRERAGQASGEPGPRRTAAKVKVDSVAGFLAVIPHLLGFHPSRSMVVVGLDRQRGRVKLAFRYDLPDPPDPATSREIAEHAAAVLRARQVTTAIAAGYGAGTLVTPVAEKLRAAMSRAGITLRDLLRVEDGRFWS